MPKIKDDPWIDSEIISDHFFKEIKSFIEQVHEGKTGTVSYTHLTLPTTHGV